MGNNTTTGEGIKVPTWLVGHVKDIHTQKGLNVYTLCSAVGNEQLELWYYGDLFYVKGYDAPFLADTKNAPGLVVAVDPVSGEEFLVFDNAKHGYDNMFCDEHDSESLKNRPLTRFEVPPSKLILRLGYSIDYEDERETEAEDTAELIDGSRMSWEQVMTDGFDYIAIYYTDIAGREIQFLDAELA